MTEPIVTLDSALLFLNLESVSDYEEEQIASLIDLVTAAIISYCGQDPRTDPEQDCSVLPLVAARLLLPLHTQITNSTTGIESQSIEGVAIKFTPDTGIDKMSQQLLSRFMKITIA